MDYEWCYRAKKNQYLLIMCKAAVIKHNPAHERTVTILDHLVFRYGWDTPERYYYQFMSMRLMHWKYHDICIDIHALYKPIKVLLLFSDKKKYIKAWVLARENFKKRFFGRYK